MRILVVDDEPAVRSSLERALRLDGYEVELAGDGSEGLAKLWDATIDAVILDVLMPTMDGVAMCRSLRIETSPSVSARSRRREAQRPRRRDRRWSDRGYPAARMAAGDPIDDLTAWLGLRWESAERVRLTIRPELINPAGLLAGPVAYAMVDYSMGSALWQQRSKGERIATINIAINYVQTAREGDVLCESVVDRRNDRIAVLSSEVRHEDGRLLATAIGSFAIFPRERLRGHERGPASP